MPVTEGWRIKHTMGSNSIKVYDKASVLRVETTINDPSEFRALASASDHCEGVRALDDLCRPCVREGRRAASFNPLTHSDLALFRAVLAGEHAIVGFRNSDLSARLHPHPPSTKLDERRRSARTSRLIAKLRAHGLVVKLKGQRLYRTTPRGYRVMSAALAVHNAHFPAVYASAA